MTNTQMSVSQWLLRGENQTKNGMGDEIQILIKLEENASTLKKSIHNETVSLIQVLGYKLISKRLADNVKISNNFVPPKHGAFKI